MEWNWNGWNCPEDIHRQCLKKQSLDHLCSCWFSACISEYPFHLHDLASVEF